ncbi:MAG: hypothetical protein ACRCWI_08790 [Brevinema sp.]
MIRVLPLLLLLVGCGKNRSIATYDIKPELFWLEEFAPLTITKNDLEYLHNYSFIYYEPLSNKYYFAIIEKTNNVIYHTNNIIDEQNFIEYEMYSPKMPLTYIGSINITNRIYIDSENNQYIKKLELIDDSYYFDRENDIQQAQFSVYPYASYFDGSEGNIYQRIFYINHTDFFVRSFAQNPYKPYSPYSRGELSSSPYIH